MNSYIHPNNFKNKKQALGALPQTPLSLARPQGAGGKPYPPTPTVSVESIQGVKGKMHDFVALDPLSISVGVAKLTEADGAGNLSRLAKQPRSGLGLYRLEATQRFCGKGAGGFSLHPCHVANAGVGSAHSVNKTLGGRAVEENVP